MADVTNVAIWGNHSATQFPDFANARIGGKPAAEVITDAGEVTRVESLIKRKYGLEFRIVTLIETIAARGRKPRFAVRITPSSSG